MIIHIRYAGNMDIGPLIDLEWDRPWLPRIGETLDLDKKYQIIDVIHVMDLIRERQLVTEPLHVYGDLATEIHIIEKDENPVINT